MKNLQIFGAQGEELVAQFIKERGLEILARNWRIKGGELDLIGRNASGLLIFIEVKTRSSRTFGDPLEAITPEKAFRLQRLALAWLATHQLWGSDYRIDCAGVILQPSGECTIDYREGVL